MSHNPAIGADELFAEHCRYGEYVEGRLRGAGLVSSRPRPTIDRDSKRRLRVGFVSGDLHEHSVGQFLEPIVAELSQRPGLELHAYCSNPVDDALSRRLQTHFAAWIPVNALSDDACAARIAADRIDVLIDLSGHTGHNRLPVFARRPAPVQASWLGYPGTTGLAAMDYYLADPVWLPPGFERMFTEKLVHLPDRWAFRPHAHAPAVGPLPALSAGTLTFGSFHRHGKINPACIALWSRLLCALPHTRLLMVGIRLEGAQEPLLEAFAAHGVERSRLTLHGRCTMDKYLAFHQHVDIALDTLPYAGATTTMHSLSMGVPTLTLAGASPQGRACAGILGNIGLHDFIATDAEDFVDRARHWDARHGELATVRADLRERLARSPGGQPALFAEHLDRALRRMWAHWCQGLPTESFATGVTEKSA
jgi:predicted O-linked N-acetylglucosamine transferase (SPINDLY family)